MIGFNTVETVQITAGIESKTVTFKSLGSSQVMVDNEGAYPVYAKPGAESFVPTEEPTLGITTILPLQSKVLVKNANEKEISFITAGGDARINASVGEGF